MPVMTVNDENQSEHSGDHRSRPRWSAGKKTDAVLRLLRGEPLEVLSRELGVEAHRLAAWRDEFVEADKQGLKGQWSSPRWLDTWVMRPSGGIHEPNSSLAANGANGSANETWSQGCLHHAWSVRRCAQPARRKGSRSTTSPQPPTSGPSPCRPSKRSASSSWAVTSRGGSCACTRRLCAWTRGRCCRHTKPGSHPSTVWIRGRHPRPTAPNRLRRLSARSRQALTTWNYQALTNQALTNQALTNQAPINQAPINQ